MSGQLIASTAKMNLHLVPIKPISILLPEHETAVKALELVSADFSGSRGNCRLKHLRLSLELGLRLED